MRLLCAFVLLVGALAGTGCTDRACTDQYESYGLVLTLANGSNSGAYQVQVEAENQLLIVDYSIDADGQASCFEDCADQAETLTIGREGGFGWPLLSGPEPALHLIVRRTTEPDWGPAAFHLRVFRDQGLVHDQDYTPTYTHSEPYGEDCGENVVATIPVDLTQ